MFMICIINSGIIIYMGNCPLSLGFFTHNAMSEIFSDNTTVSDIPQNLIIDIKNMNLPLLCRK